MPPLLRALIFGATLAVAVGPIAVLIVQCGLTRGFGSAARCGLGAGLADFTYALIAFTVGPAISGLLVAHRREVEVVASLVLVGFGFWMIWSALRARKAVGEGEMKPVANRREIATTFVLTIVNPLTVLAFVSFSAQLGLDPSWRQAIGLSLALFLGSLTIQLGLALAGSRLRRYVTDPRWVAGLNVASGVGIVLFGAAGLI
ncbi:MAG TPA: LysE family transporter [Thermoanaerobaculia bacterium]|nr:LysE family transporter [Thermoanaerobaculia bacterium]